MSKLVHDIHKCGVCGCDTFVIDSRKASVLGIGVRLRRRVCKNSICGERFTTYEIPKSLLKALLDE